MKLTHTTIVRLATLLPMLYKPAEIAETLAVPQSTIRDWLRTGAPHTREANRIWIPGREFAEWLENNRPKKARRPRMRDDQAYCFRCKKAVQLKDIEITPGKGRLYYIKGNCPKCGNKIVRGGRANDRAH